MRATRLPRPVCGFVRRFGPCRRVVACPKLSFSPLHCIHVKIKMHTPDMLAQPKEESPYCASRSSRSSGNTAPDLAEIGTVGLLTRTRTQRSYFCADPSSGALLGKAPRTTNSHLTRTQPSPLRHKKGYGEDPSNPLPCPLLLAPREEPLVQLHIRSSRNN